MSGRVYFIKNQRGHVKIGFTAGSAGNRLRTLQTGAETRLEVLAVAVGDRAKALTAPIPALVDHAISQALATARAGLEMLRMPALATARKLMERS